MITPADVKIIIDTELEDSALDAYIVDATEFANSIGITAELVIKYITAHMISSTKERLAEQEGAGGASIKYQGVFGAGLKSTAWGQIAMSMDKTGNLSRVAIGNRPITIYAVR